MGDAPGPVLILHSSDEWYGADRMVAELADVARRTLARPVLVWLPEESGTPASPRLSEVLRDRGIEVRHLALPVLRRRSLTPMGVRQVFRDAMRLRGQVKQVSPSLVIGGTSAMLPALAAAPRGAAVLLYAQEIWRPRERELLGLLGAPVDVVMAISDPVAAALPARLRRRATVVTNGVPERPEPVVPPPAEPPLRFLVASRWNSWKGHEYLLQAWEAAGCPGHLTILGGPPGAGIAVDVPGLVRRLSDPSSVRIVGEVGDITEWLDASDALILPSTNPEPFGLVVIEAFARARPVIATNHGAPATVVEPAAGWLVPPDDPTAFAAVLRSITKQEAARRGETARALFQRRYSIEAWRGGASRLLAGFAG